jgi:hypothetical protein
MGINWTKKPFRNSLKTVYTDIDTYLESIENEGSGAITGNKYYVDGNNANAVDSTAAGSESVPFATIDYAVGIATANNGDVIFVKPGHTETLAAATGLVIDKAGISIIGLGIGNDRPKLTLGTLATTTITISAASVAFKNFIIVGALDGLNSAITVTGDYCDIDVEYWDTSAAVESNIAITCTSVDKGKIKLKYVGFIAGNAVTNAIVLDGCTSLAVDVDFYGNSSAAVVEFLNNACHNILVGGYFYNESSAALSLIIDDTATGSTWFACGYAGKEGYDFIGGSSAALSALSTTGIAAALSTIDGFHDVTGAADSAANSQIRDVVGRKDDTVAGDSVIALVKQIIALAGTPAADLAADIAAIKAVVDIINTASVTEIAEILAGVDTEIAQIIAAVAVVDGLQDIPSIDLATNATMNQVIGNKSDTVGGTSIIALVKQALAALVVVDAFHDVPSADSADNTVVSDVLGNKTDTVAGNSVIALLKQIIEDTGTTLDGAISTIDGLLDVPTQDLATDATINQVVGKKSDTTGGTSIVALVKQALAAVVTVDGFHDVTGAADSAANSQIRDVVGRKDDTVAGDSVIALLKQIIVDSGTDIPTLLGTPVADVSTDVAAIKTEADKIETPSAACNRQAGKTQIFTKNITAAANAGVTTVGTITTQPCLIKRIVLRANGVTTADLTSAAIEGGASQAVEFISAATAVTASINADDEQVAFSGAAMLKATKTITIDLQGTGGTAVDLDVIVEYCSTVAGGYIA